MRSKRFRGKFRCFSRAKVGARAKKKRGRGREEKVLLSSPLFLFCSCPNFRAVKTSKFATETLATQAKKIVKCPSFAQAGGDVEVPISSCTANANHHQVSKALPLPHPKRRVYISATSMVTASFKTVTSVYKHKQLARVEIITDFSRTRCLVLIRCLVYTEAVTVNSSVTPFKQTLILDSFISFLLDA